MKILVFDLTGPALNFAVATALGEPYFEPVATTNELGMEFPAHDFVGDFNQGGRIINDAHISVMWRKAQNQFWATVSDAPEDEETLGHFGSTFVEAGLRAFVAAYLGDEVDAIEVPDHVLTQREPVKIPRRAP